MLRTFDKHDEVDLGIEIDLDLEVVIGVRDLACHMDSLRIICSIYLDKFLFGRILSID